MWEFLINIYINIIGSLNDLLITICAHTINILDSFWEWKNRPPIDPLLKEFDLMKSWASNGVGTQTETIVDIKTKVKVPSVEDRQTTICSIKNINWFVDPDIFNNCLHHYKKSLVSTGIQVDNNDIKQIIEEVIITLKDVDPSINGVNNPQDIILDQNGNHVGIIKYPRDKVSSYYY